MEFFFITVCQHWIVKKNSGKELLKLNMSSPVCQERVEPGQEGFGSWNIVYELKDSAMLLNSRV